MIENEKRRFKRMNANLELNISKLFNQDNVIISNVDAPITVVDISKGGIGFITTATLPIGYYFNAKLQLGDEDSMLYTVVRIVRCTLSENGEASRYGAEFIGLAPVLDFIFDQYESSLNKQYNNISAGV
jgi:c-di-GMP-binding flagellar brake protein YcgR